MHRRHALIALALLPAAPATAATGGAGIDFHDARYCEILELKGAPPDATVMVWNTIGLNRCPAAWWEAFDAPSLAKELGDTLVVLNGPRHFLMDGASAVTGGTKAFHGVRMTKVAELPIRTAADLDQTPYRDRTVARRNTWSWKRGRPVFELVAPGGDTYVMQSYAQIEDPSLTLADLPALGPKLDLPAGWRYRRRTLRKPLDLVARGKATILQDDLQNTYQLAATTRPKGPRVAHTLHLDAATRKIPEREPGVVEDHGTFTGTLGKGSIVIKGTFHDGVFDATFRMLLPRGSVVGTTKLPFTVADGEIDFKGTGTVTGGTGAYRGITGTGLAIHDHNTVDGQNGVVTVDGSVTY